MRIGCSLLRLLFLVQIFILCGAMHGQSTSPTASCPRSICGPPPPPPHYANVPSYYGFYDSSSPGFPDETQATATFANTVWIGCESPQDCDARLQEAKFFKMNAYVAIPGCGAISNASTWNTSYWQKYEPVFAPYVSNGTIVALEPCDEIFGAWTPGNNAAAITSELSAVASIIKQSFPAVKVPMILTGAVTFTFFQHGQNIIPSNIDWVAIDIYGCYSTCGYSDQYTTISEPYSWYIQTLEANLSPSQKVMILPGTSIYVGSSYDQFLSAEVNTTGWQNYVAGQASGVIQPILTDVENDTHIVAVFGFEYQSYFETTSLSTAGQGMWVGPNDPSMVPVMDQMTTFGANVVKRSFFQPSTPAGTIATGQPVELINDNSSKCLDVTGVSTSSGALLQQWQCLGAGQLNQMWKLYQWDPGAHPGQYQLISVNNNFFNAPMCLDLQNGGTANGTPVQQYTCASAGTDSNQLWNLVASGSGFKLVSASSGNCLDVYADETGSGVQVFSWQCIQGVASQIWIPTAPALQAAGTAASNPVF